MQLLAPATAKITNVSLGVESFRLFHLQVSREFVILWSAQHLNPLFSFGESPQHESLWEAVSFVSTCFPSLAL